MKRLTQKGISKESQLLIKETQEHVCQTFKINYSKLKSKPKALLDRMIVALIRFELEVKNEKEEEAKA
jgi:hypothetical protein